MIAKPWLNILGVVLLAAPVQWTQAVRDAIQPLAPSVADVQPTAGESGEGLWRQGIVSNDRGKLPYQFFTPEKAGAEPLPLVLFLHGSGEAGVDNRLQMYADRNVGPTFFASPGIQQDFQAYVLAPQTPKAIRWASDDLHEYDFDNTPVTVSMELVLGLIDDLLELHPIDRSRVYVGGLSRGGQGAWNAILQRPELFAAAFPMAGGGSPPHAHRIAHLAIWGFHGTADRITPPRYSRRMYEAVYALSPDPDRVRLTEYEGGIHRSAWLQGHAEPDFPQWIFKWRNPNVAAPLLSVRED